ncbi:Spleen exonuclease [Bertholletia excelsa]
MGVKNLWDILESCKKTLPLHHLRNKRICIDLSCWMVQLQNVNKSHCLLKDKFYLKGLFHRLRALISLNCSLIFVTDGSIPAIKISTYRRRLKLGTEAVQDDKSSYQVTSLRRNMGSEFSCMIKEAKLLGMALGIPCLDGIEEAEAQCALLNLESICDGCFTSDSDVFLFGAKTVYRDICLGEGGYVVCYEMSDIETKLGFGRNSLITLAILLGSDYFPGVRGLGPESACRIVKSVGDSAVLQHIASEGLSFAKKLKASMKKGNTIRYNFEEESDNEIKVNGDAHNLQGQDQLQQVIHAYLKPKCHSVDSEAVHRVLAFHPFQRSKLQQICAQCFDWPPEKTDEYILPKIAERDLWQFANLHCTSSELGVQLALDKMPVKCPVSGIVKPRKVHGQECFEVSWEDMHGLNTSIVPADLIKSACPEKIQEFEERRAQGKKPRQKKSETRADIEKIDLKLQDLLLGTELESRTSLRPPLSMEKASETRNDTSHIDLVNQKLVHFVEEKSKTKLKTASNCHPTSSSAETVEVIDLLSPSPHVPGCRVPKCQQGEVECIDIIDLSDSETEASPEHARKARELRLFLSSIREELK